MEKDYVERKRARRERGRKRDWERERETMEKERGRERLGEGERDYGERERRRDREYGEREILREGERGDGGEREREREVGRSYQNSAIRGLFPSHGLLATYGSPTSHLSEMRKIQSRRTLFPTSWTEYETTFSFLQLIAEKVERNKGNQIFELMTGKEMKAL